MTKAASAAKGLDNLDKLTEQAQGELPDISFKPLAVDPPSGWRIRDLKHSHLLAFYDAETLTTKHKSIFHEAQANCAAAITAGFFDKPTAVTVEVLADMDWQDVRQLQVAVLNSISNAVNTPKN